MRLIRPNGGDPEVVESLDDKAVRWALTGEWLTLALARVEQVFATDAPAQETVAYGFVHHDRGSGRHLRAKLTLERRTDARRLGSAFIDTFDSSPPVCLMHVVVSDPDGAAGDRLLTAMDRAARSNMRFLHVRFRRERSDVDDLVGDLAGKGGGAHHDLFAMTFTDQLILPRSPTMARGWAGL